MGYAGGTTPDPTYHRMGDHTESIQIDYDPEIVSYQDLLAAFIGMHDPWRPAHSTQYASLVLCADDLQRESADKALAYWPAQFGRPVFTKVVPLDTFFPAEGYHQKYYWEQFARQWGKKNRAPVPDWRSDEFSHWLETGTILVCGVGVGV